jgi:hypothetical protein
MSLIHYVRPFLELGISKEYCMARKTIGNTATTRSKKAGSSVQSAATPGSSEVPKKKLATVVPAGNGSGNLEEEIRHRAYELYLERRATSGHEAGDENQDWLIAEREIRSRRVGQEQHTA